jgi:hypothetical protein
VSSYGQDGFARIGSAESSVAGAPVTGDLDGGNRDPVDPGHLQNILGSAGAADDNAVAGFTINGRDDVEFVAVGTGEHRQGINIVVEASYHTVLACQWGSWFCSCRYASRDTSKARIV